MGMLTSAGAVEQPSRSKNAARPSQSGLFRLGHAAISEQNGLLDEEGRSSTRQRAETPYALARTDAPSPSVTSTTPVAPSTSRMTSPTAGSSIRLPASGFLTLRTGVVMLAVT